MRMAQNMTSSQKTELNQGVQPRGTAFSLKTGDVLRRVSVLSTGVVKRLNKFRNPLEKLTWFTVSDCSSLGACGLCCSFRAKATELNKTVQIRSPKTFFIVVV